MFSRKKVVSKYELVEPSEISMANHNLDGKGWMQLKALRSFGNVKKGDLGGYVKDTFLSQSGLCWIEKGCKVNNCFVGDNAIIKGESIVEGSTLKDNALIDRSNITLLDSCNKKIVTLCDNAKIVNCADIIIMDKLELCDNASIYNVANLQIDSCSISGDSQIGINEE